MWLLTDKPQPESQWTFGGSHDQLIFCPLSFIQIMAEAHQAISYSESLIHQHSNANHDQEVLQLVWQSGWRSWKKRFAKFRSGVRNGLYPAHLESLWVVLAIVLGLHFTVNKVPYNLVNRFASHLPRYFITTV